MHQLAMKLEVRLDGRKLIATALGLVELFEQLEELSDVVFGCGLSRLLRRHSLERHRDVEELIDVAALEHRHLNTSSRYRGHEPDPLELHERSSNRPSADGESLCEGRFDEVLPGGKLPADDQLAKLTADHLPQLPMSCSERLGSGPRAHRSASVKRCLCAVNR